jgi:hypothetical protein
VKYGSQLEAAARQARQQEDEIRSYQQRLRDAEARLKSVSEDLDTANLKLLAADQENRRLQIEMVEFEDINQRLQRHSILLRYFTTHMYAKDFRYRVAATQLHETVLEVMQALWERQMNSDDEYDSLHPVEALIPETITVDDDGRRIRTRGGSGGGGGGLNNTSSSTKKKKNSLKSRSRSHSVSPAMSKSSSPSMSSMRVTPTNRNDRNDAASTSRLSVHTDDDDDDGGMQTKPFVAGDALMPSPTLKKSRMNLSPNSSPMPQPRTMTDHSHDRRPHPTTTTTTTTSPSRPLLLMEKSEDLRLDMPQEHDRRGSLVAGNVHDHVNDSDADVWVHNNEFDHNRVRIKYDVDHPHNRLTPDFLFSPVSRKRVIFLMCHFICVDVLFV